MDRYVGIYLEEYLGRTDRDYRCLRLQDLLCASLVSGVLSGELASTTDNG